MYRLTVHQTSPDTVRVTHKPTGFTYEHHAPTQRHLVVVLKGTMRDLLFHHHGDEWHLREQHHMRGIKRSIISAVRRMR